MSPQFVDFDGDGQLDIVAGIFDGSPHLSLGSNEGFAQPEQILDAQGQRIVLNQFWNYETEEWDETRRCDASGHENPGGHGTSAVVFDWDADGDLDLLLGDYDTGRIYRRVNEGKAGAPRFAGVNLPVLQGDEPLVIPGRIETIRLADWDGDELTDLLCGSVESQDAGVYWVRNAGRHGEPRFDRPRALVTGRPELGPPPAQPQGGFYPDAGDIDGDGDLDLVVGAKGHWDEPPRALTDEERARLARIEAELTELGKAVDAFYEKLQEDMEELGEDSQEAEQLAQERQAEIKPLLQRQRALSEEQDGLTFGKKEGYFVWLYENRGA